MRQEERRAYRWQLNGDIRIGAFKEFPDKELIAVILPEVEIRSLRTEKTKKKFRGKDGKEHYREYRRTYEAVSVYKRGEVLYAILRKANEAEKEIWKETNEEELKRLGIVKRHGELWIPVVAKIEEGLPAAVRQRIRHIPASLIERRGRKFAIAGDAQKLGNYAGRIEEITRPLLTVTSPSSEFLERASDEFLQALSFLERGRTWLVKRAREEMLLARQGRFWQMAAHGGAALAALLEERARKFELAVKSYNRGVKWATLDEETRQKFKYAYEGLGKLGMRLNQFETKGKTPLPNDTVVGQAIGIYHYLSDAEGSHFKPYSDRVYSEEFQSLKEIPELAERGKWWPSISNIIERATAKLEVIAKGERPSRAEIQRWKGIFDQGVASS